LANLKKCLRTCIFCRKKHEQKELIRLKCEDKKLVPYNNDGRSFYICYECKEIIESNTSQKVYRRIERSLMKECKNNDKYVVQLKEILTDGR
jgi:predicted RNA-binding protein YlxR (DUF448 family)